MSGESVTQRAPSEQELRGLLATSCRILYRLGLSDYLGHPSARVAGTDRVIIKPKHSLRVRGMDRMTAEMMVVIDLDGSLVEGDEIPPSERFIHTEIYRARPEVLSVVHTHQPMSVLCGSVGLPILPILHVEAPHVERSIPTLPLAELIVTPEAGRLVADAIGDSTYCHLKGHGIVSVAKTVQDSTLGAIHLERAAEANVRARQLGLAPWVIPSDQVANLRQQLAAPAGRWAYYAELAG